tara:strand:+ start:1256 stop:1474 length:219 start_codon:yes stop_codon:yes gene_type:complete
MTTLLHITSVLPRAERVQLSLLKDRYSFSDTQLEEIKTNWIKDNNYNDCYVKPGGKYDIPSVQALDVNPQDM